MGGYPSLGGLVGFAALLADWVWKVGGHATLGAPDFRAGVYSTLSPCFACAPFAPGRVSMMLSSQKPYAPTSSLDAARAWNRGRRKGLGTGPRPTNAGGLTELELELDAFASSTQRLGRRLRNGPKARTTAAPHRLWMAEGDFVRPNHLPKWTLTSPTLEMPSSGPHATQSCSDGGPFSPRNHCIRTHQDTLALFCHVRLRREGVIKTELRTSSRYQCG